MPFILSLELYVIVNRKFMSLWCVFDQLLSFCGNEMGNMMYTHLTALCPGLPG